MKRLFALFAVMCLCWVGFVGCSSSDSTPFTEDDDAGQTGDAAKSDGGGFQSDGSTHDGAVTEDGRAPVDAGEDGAIVVVDSGFDAGVDAGPSFNVMSAASTGLTTMTVTFDAPPNATEAANPANYAVSGATGLNVSAPALSGNTVTLTTTTQSAIAYTVTVTGVTRADDGRALALDHATFTGIGAFDVSTAVATSPTTVNVTFDAVPNATAAALATNFTISDGTNPLTVSAAVLSGSTVTLTTAVQSAKTYTVTVANVTRNSDAQPLSVSTADFTGIAPFNVTSATATSPTTVTVVFDAPPTTALATLATNYAISDGTNPLAVTAAALTGSTVTLTTATQSAIAYTVTVSNVKRASDSASLATSTATFTGIAATAPTVTNVVATSTPYNTGTTAVTITGSGFAGIACTTAVKLDDLDGAGNAVGTPLSAGCTVDSNTQISGVFPAGIRTNGGTGWNVLVTNAVSTNTASDVKFVPVAGLLISEVMVGSGATAASDHEFIEIYNPTAAAIDTVALGLKLHTRSSGGGDSGNKPITLVTGKTLTIASHGYLLLATKNLTGDTWDATIDGTYASSSLVANGGVYISLSTVSNEKVIDKLGWGAQPAGGFEGTVFATNLTNDNSTQRSPGSAAGNRTDSDVNSTDFLAPSTAITPKGSADAVEP